MRSLAPVRPFLKGPKLRRLRPSATLDDAQCESVWKMASPNGDTLSQDKAVPYVVNFQLVDSDKDGKISADEFKAGCGKGWIQGADASTVHDMKSSPDMKPDEGGNMKPDQE